MSETFKNIIKITFLLCYFFVLPPVVYSIFNKGEAVFIAMLVVVLLLALFVKFRSTLDEFGYYVCGNNCKKHSVNE